MNNLRGERVIVELIPEDKKKDAYREVGGVLMPVQEEEKGALVKAIVKKIGHLISPREIPLGATVYVRPHQGERLYPTTLEYLYRSDDIIAYD